MSYPAEMKDALCAAAIPLIAEGKLLLNIAQQFGVPRHKLHDWLNGTPERAEQYAQARDKGWDAMAESLYNMVMDESLNAKDRRVRLDGGMKLLARWCPQRYGEAVLLKHEVAGEVEEMSSFEMVSELAKMLGHEAPKLPAPLEAEWSDVPS